MPDLQVEDFDAYFRAVHGDDPFKWQTRLLREVVRERRWPLTLDLPTGSGKTAAIDVALFHLAIDRGASAPRRIVLVVDRRTVVDQAFERANKIVRALTESSEPVVRRVAERLQGLVAGGDACAPLAAAQLRGGMPRDDSWARRPDQPLVAVSTVDQVGSRLLFRGYGVGEGMRSVHAGLLAQDTLILLDEVHLSEPFRATLESVAHYRERSQIRLPNRWQVVAMSATPREEKRDERRFALDETDERDERLMVRLRASKPVQLVPEVKVSGLAATKHRTFAAVCAEHAARFAEPGKCVGVVVNRVDSAREIYALLRTRFSSGVYLVTGRMRPLDRTIRDKKVGALVSSARQRNSHDEPVIVVATQCIEAGADFDFDALVTECASLDALRQRFGRLNRRGEINDARAVVLARSDSLAKDDPDPVYGTALPDTWTWLKETQRDFGVLAMNEALAKEEGERRLKLFAPLGRAPVMLPAHLDAWSQTRPEPFPDPDVSLWLHGVDQESPPEVQLVWRADITEGLLHAAITDDAKAALAARIEVCAPTGLEAVSLPIHAVRAWLAGEVPAEVADVERTLPSEDTKEVGTPRPAVCWRDGDATVVSFSKIRPGDTLVVPSEYGGLTDGTWDPSSNTEVADLGHIARWQQTRRPVLRVIDKLLSPELPTAIDVGTLGEAEDREAAADWLSRALEALESSEVARSSPLKEAIESLEASKYSVVRLDPVPRDGPPIARGYLVLVGRRRVYDDGASGWAEDDGSSLTGVAVALSDHMRGVEMWARRFASNCGLPPSVAEDIALAARWHDAGKADIRFQRMLRGANAFRAEGGDEPLAKSATLAGDRAARRKAQKLSGYPAGARHELSSVALLDKQGSLLARAGDRELVLHLVASHHGWCRPFAPVAHDAEPVEIALQIEGTEIRVRSDHRLERLDSGVSDRFWLLTERYGWYGLAWLEAILRLADHRESEAEQSKDWRPNAEVPQ